MNYLHKMYGRKNNQSSAYEKNPNRVAGGLKAQGADHYTLVAEDGFEKQIPSHKYVQTLEDQQKKMRAAIEVLQRKQARQESVIENLTNYIKKS